MKQLISAPVVFGIAAAYDGLLGLGFLFFPRPLFDLIEATPPGHWGYIQFPAALLIVFALMFIAVAIQPMQNRNLVPYGVLLKLSYCGVVGYYWALTDIPLIWKQFAVADAVFAVLFLWVWIRLALWR